MHSLVVGTAGHIDHGKSTLVEALTGTHPDRLAEEKARGITIDLGFAHAAIGSLNVAFIDVPGHERFVRNMLAGVGGIDAVMLIVAADESVMPQTREHFHICRMLGIRRGLVALTKIDRVDRDTVDLVTLEVRELIAGSFLDGAPIVPVSVRTGAGLDALRATLVSLADLAPRQAREGVVRVPVDRVFTVKGFGTVVTGTLVSGHVHAGSELVALPSARAVRVRGIQMHGASVSEARAPGRVALNLGAVEVHELTRGATLATAGSLAITQRLDVRLEALPGGPSLRHGARIRVHHGTSETTARLVLCAIRRTSGSPWELLQPGQAHVIVPPGGNAYARLRLEGAMAVTRDDRLVLRAITPAASIGGAQVLDPEPPATALRRQNSLDRFSMLDGADAADGAGTVLLLWLFERGAEGLTSSDAVRRGGLDPRAAAASMDRLVARGDAIEVHGRCFHSAAVREIERQIAAALTRFHRGQPADPGMPREGLREQVMPHGARDLFDAIMEQLSQRQVIRGSERIALTSHAPSASEADARARETIEETFRRAGLEPPDSAAVQGIAGVSQAVFDRQARDLIRDRRLARLDTLFFHADALATLRRDILTLKEDAPGGDQTWLDLATFKTRFGLSRKFAIPLLEWLDRERVTRRVGDRRLVL